MASKRFEFLACFLESSVDNSISVLYLVGLEHRNVLEPLLRKSSIPKVILDSEASVGVIDESCLVILFLDVQNELQETNGIQTKFSNIGITPWKVHVLILVENKFFQRPQTVKMLDSALHKLGISYWAVTTEYGNSTVKYAVNLAGKTLFYEGVLDYQRVFTYRRLAPIERPQINAQWYASFPYTYMTTYMTLGGIDHFIFSRLVEYLRIDLNVIDARNGSLEVAYGPRAIVSNLLDQKVDVTMTRRQFDALVFPMIVLPEPVHISLVVPRKTVVSYLDILLKPFSEALWICIFCVTIASHVINTIGSTDTRLVIFLSTLRRNELVKRSMQACGFVVKFILIESYFAQVTAYLLAHRYQRDPETLYEFLATGITVQLTKQHQELVMSLAPKLASAIMQRATIVPYVYKFTAQYAYLDTAERASFTINILLKPDRITGRRSCFVLREPLKAYRVAYLFAAHAIPLRDYFAINLEWIRSFGFMSLAERTNTKLIASIVKRAVFSEQLIKFEHMVPFWLFVASGWMTAGAVFFGECTIAGGCRLMRKWKTT